MTGEELEQVDSVLMLQRRYHTNQHPIIKLLVERGHEVHFLALAKEPQEEYSVIQPDLIHYSTIFLLFESLINRVVSDMFRYRYGFPSFIWYYRYLQQKDPDIIIIKEYYVNSILTTLYAKWFDIDLIFYDQAPVYGSDISYTKRRFAYIVYYLLYKERFVRFSPVLGNPSAGYAVPRSHYIPFVADSNLDIKHRTYDQGDEIKIIMIGKLHSRRKNHLSVIKVVDVLADMYNVSLTLIGSLYDEADPYYNELITVIESNDLEEVVDIKQNLSYKTVQEEYRKHDIYVLPSKRETAAVSHLEAMSEGLPVICSHSNGTSSYINEGGNGFLIDCQDQDDIRKKLERLVSSPALIREFGKQSHHLAHTEFSPERFYRRLSWLLEEDF